jgi:hypothetical protein
MQSHARPSRCTQLPLLAMIALAGAIIGCATDPPPPLPVRPYDPSVILAWTIERGLYEEGPARATEVVTVRATGGEGGGEVVVQDFGMTRRGDRRPPRAPTIARRALNAAEMDALGHALAALELPDVARRAEHPNLVPWTIWGICLPVSKRTTQCGQLWVDEWNGVGGAPELFALLQAWRQDTKRRAAGP